MLSSLGGNNEFVGMCEGGRDTKFSSREWFCSDAEAVEDEISNSRAIPIGRLIAARIGTAKIHLPEAACSATAENLDNFIATKKYDREGSFRTGACSGGSISSESTQRDLGKVGSSPL